MSAGDDARVCSAKGCQRPPTWALLWNNPKLHTPDRRKIWLACDDAPQSLSDFLGARQFLKDVVAAPRTLPEPTRVRQPPIADIGRSGCRNVGSSMPCPARLPRIATTQRSAISSSVAPARSAAAQVGLLAGEQAVADLAVGGEPDPVAVAAERPGDRGDHADGGRAAVDQEQLGGGAPPRLRGRA